MRPERKLGEILVDLRVLTHAEVERVLQALRRRLDHPKFGQVARDMGLLREEHVWAEFQLASRLVCVGGLIMIHDARYEHGKVKQALQRIENASYGVTRLWTAERGFDEDDHLGLAVIENRVRAC